MVDKYWIGGKSGDEYNYDNDENWSPVSIRNTSVQWTASGSGTSEYYLEVSGGGNPATGDLSGLVEPDAVYEGGTALTGGTAGSLAASEWDWADNDTLGYSTIYVRTSGSVDPDTLALDNITFTDQPNANDNVFIGQSVTAAGAATSYNISSGLDQSNIELDDFIVLPEYTGTIGSATQPLAIDMADADTFKFAGRGTAYIDVGSWGGDPIIQQTKAATSGQSGLYLTGSAIDVLSIESGSVQLNGATVTTAQIRSRASLTVRYDSTTTTIENSGTTLFNGTATTINCYEGVVTITGSDATAVNVYGGTVYNDGTGTATVTLYGGTFDSDRDGRSKSVTLTLNGGIAEIGPNVTLTDTLNVKARIIG